MLSHLVPLAGSHQDMCFNVVTLTLVSLSMWPQRHMKRTGELPTWRLNAMNWSSSLKRRVSGSVALTGSVALSRGSLLPSIKRTSAIFRPAPVRRSPRISEGIAMRSNRCICFNWRMSAMVVTGVGALGNDALWSIAVAVVLRRSIVMRHAVWTKAALSSSNLTAVNFHVLPTGKRWCNFCSSFLSCFCSLATPRQYCSGMWDWSTTSSFCVVDDRARDFQLVLACLSSLLIEQFGKLCFVTVLCSSSVIAGCFMRHGCWWNDLWRKGTIPQVWDRDCGTRAKRNTNTYINEN